jgi:hypothetical protein
VSTLLLDTDVFSYLFKDHPLAEAYRPHVKVCDEQASRPKAQTYKAGSADLLFRSAALELTAFDPT